MKKFRFRLERVLAFRGVERDERKRVLIEAQGALRQSEERIEYLESERVKSELDQQNTLPVEQYMLAGMYKERLKSEIHELRIVIQKQEEVVQSAMAAYIEASKEVKTLDSLKDKRQREYNELVSQADARFLDEIATQRGNTMKGHKEG
jgi:flagellar export protein FliJ